VRFHDLVFITRLLFNVKKRHRHCLAVQNAQQQPRFLIQNSLLGLSGFKPRTSGFLVLAKSGYLVGLPCLSILLSVGFSPYSAAVVPKLFPTFGVNPLGGTVSLGTASVFWNEFHCQKHTTEKWRRSLVKTLWLSISWPPSIPSKRFRTLNPRIDRFAVWCNLFELEIHADSARIAHPGRD
jgi:hypothetical protein